MMPSTHVSETSFEEINRIFNLQKVNNQAVKNSSDKDRCKKLQKLQRAIHSQREGIRNAVHADFLKPKEEVDLTEIYPLIVEIKSFCKDLSKWMEPEEIESPITMIGSMASIVREPKGNCLLLSPWNYPFQLAISPIISAIAAGNVCMLKPSEMTPHTSKFIKEFIASVFNENEVAVIEGGMEVSSYLLSLPFDHIHFTGSPAVGKIVMKAASEHLCSVTLELGGKSPVIIDETADVTECAAKIGWGKFMNSGQTCIAPDYLFIHESKKQAFIEAMRLQLVKMYGQHPAQSQSIAHMVNAKHYTRVKTWLAEAIQNGASVDLGGDSNDDQNFMAPTLLSNVTMDSKLLTEEIFGPILPIISFKNVDEALEHINKNQKPLALYIFSKKNKNIDYIMQNTSAGGTCINDTMIHQAHPNLPFGGVNNSGLGKSHGIWGFREFSNERAVVRQYLKKGLVGLMYPPYNNFVRRMINLTIQFF
jgi:aldehyde dehydrogenase (NAD+)